MEKEIELILFLSKIVTRNTHAYQSDFQYDIAMLQKAAGDSNPENRTFYWLSRPCGTWCVRERDVFLRETEGHAIWIYQEPEADQIIAYRVTVTGEREGKPVGNVRKLNYKEQVQRVKQNALPVATATLYFKDMPPLTMTYEELHGSRIRLADQYGTPERTRYAPQDEAELESVIAAEHLFQNGRKRKPPGKAASSPERGGK